MNKLFKHLIYCATGIIIILLLYKVGKLVMDYYNSRSPREKLILLSIVGACAMFVLVVGASGQAGQRRLENGIYEGYEHYNDPSSAELDARAKRRENGTMTSDDFN